MFQKHKKTPVKFSLKGLPFSSAIKNEMEKILVTVGGLMVGKYNLIKGKLR